MLSIVSSMEDQLESAPPTISHNTLFFILIPLFSIFFFFKLAVTHRAKKKTPPNLPPGPPKLPFIGNMTHIMGSQPLHTLGDLAKKHGPLMHLQIGHVSMIVASSPEVAEDIMKTHDLSFASRPAILSASILSYGRTDVAFAPYGPYWRNVRKICVLELLSTKRIQSFRLLRESEVSAFARSMVLDSPTPVNLTDKIFSLINDMVCRAAFGMKNTGDYGGLRELTKSLVEAGSGFCVGDFFPSLQFVSTITGLKARLEKHHGKLNGILNEIIKQHREKKEKRDEEETEYLLDVLLRLQKSGTPEITLTDDNIKSIIMDMFIAGTDTSSSTIEWAMVELMRNPRCMEKAQKEMREILQGKGKVEESDAQGLNYLKLIIKETLRLHPPVPLLLPRESMERCTIRGYEIPAKSRVLVNAYAIGRDPKHWENAEDFKPERFDGSMIDFKGQNFEYIPFGSGRRGCPGISFGVAQMELVLANLLYHFDWKLPEGMKPMDLDMAETFGTTVSRKARLSLIPILVNPFKQ